MHRNSVVYSLFVIIYLLIIIIYFKIVILKQCVQCMCTTCLYECVHVLHVCMCGHHIHVCVYMYVWICDKSTDVSPNRNQHLPLGNATGQDFLSFEELLDQWIPAHLRPKSYHTHVCSKNCCFSCLGLW